MLVATFDRDVDGVAIDDAYDDGVGRPCGVGGGGGGAGRSPSACGGQHHEPARPQLHCDRSTARFRRMSAAPVGEAEVREAIEQLGVEHEIVACDPALADTAAFCSTYGYALDDSANTIVVVGKSDPPLYVACVVLATTRLDVNKAVRTRLGVKKASFASGDQTVELTGM